MAYNAEADKWNQAEIVHPRRMDRAMVVQAVCRLVRRLIEFRGKKGHPKERNAGPSNEMGVLFAVALQEQNNQVQLFYVSSATLCVVIYMTLHGKQGFDRWQQGIGCLNWAAAVLETSSSL